MTFTLVGPAFEGTLVRLEPLGPHHAADLAAAAEEGRLRDSAIYSVTAAEWPACRERLERRVRSAAPVLTPRR
ncbi:hypothetical protein ACVV2G_10785 [Streptomyces ziwulingensis]